MVKWSDSSKKDLKKIYDYIASDSPVYAKKILSSIIKKALTLNAFPEMGRMVPEIMDTTIRELIVSHYRILYSISENKKNVEILSVIHGKRNFDEAFEYDG